MVPCSQSNFDPENWAKSRSIKLPHNFQAPYAVLTIDSEIAEKCKQDLSDIRVVNSQDLEVSSYLLLHDKWPRPSSYEGKITKLAKFPGRWTDVWVDKGNKLLSAGILLQSSSKNFMRKVEIRGSDTTKEYYIVAMDSLIADISSPFPLSALTINHPLNNFQYVHLRIIDGDAGPIAIDNVEFIPQRPENPVMKSQEMRILEKKTDPGTGDIVIIGDLGEKRYSLAQLNLVSQEYEFMKKLIISTCKDFRSPSWQRIHEGQFFRLRREEAYQENTHFRFNADPSRYVKLELTSGTRKPINIEKIEALSVPPLVVFEFQEGEQYRLLYSNPKSVGSPAKLQTPIPNITSLAQLSSLGEEYNYTRSMMRNRPPLLHQVSRFHL